ncbi:MAG TPA: hypothetical protein VNR89_00810 [Roseomonas sp.]|nr:hypothetical protein [Roseomonas sp.]
MAGHGDDNRHDPGDSVPEGVAPASPPPAPSAEDLKVKRKLEDLARKPGDTAPPPRQDSR